LTHPLVLHTKMVCSVAVAEAFRATCWSFL